jgi:NAD(P)-dependent dehydrogenase (short-subunit alcohol dehydrogenase family)
VTIGFQSNEERANMLAASVEEAGGSAAVHQVDMREGESIQEFLTGAASDWQGLQAIVSATGPAIPLCPLNEVSEEDFRRIYDTDVLGSFNVIRHGTAQLRESGGGSIVLLLTTAVGRTLENDGMSGGPKTAVSALMRHAAREVGAWNVRLNGVAPGVIDAGIVHASFEVDDVAKGDNQLLEPDAPGPHGRPRGRGCAGRLPGVQRRVLHQRAGHRGRRRLQRMKVR